MTIERFDGCTGEAYKKATRGYGMVFEEFGPPATGKTRRANALAEMLSMQGKRVLIADDLPGHDSYPGVRVFVKKNKPTHSYPRRGFAAICANRAGRLPG